MIYDPGYRSKRIDRHGDSGLANDANKTDEMRVREGER